MELIPYTGKRATLAQWRRNLRIRLEALGVESMANMATITGVSRQAWRKRCDDLFKRPASDPRRRNLYAILMLDPDAGALDSCDPLAVGCAGLPDDQAAWVEWATANADSLVSTKGDNGMELPSELWVSE